MIPFLRPALALLLVFGSTVASALPASPEEVVSSADSTASFGALSRPLVPADLRALADLDGDPATVTAEEEEMFRVLLEVVTGLPVPQVD